MEETTITEKCGYLMQNQQDSLTDAADYYQNWFLFA